MTSTTDDLVQQAILGTARRLEQDIATHGIAKVGEIKHQTPAFRSALTASGAPDVHPSAVKLPIPSWMPSPGAFDVLLGQPRGWRALFELKWARSKDELGWTFWDIYKLAAGAHEYGVPGYAIVGAPVSYWVDENVDCSAMYCNREWISSELFHRYERAWVNLLAGGTARPLRVPTSLTTRLVAAERLDVAPAWEIRALAVTKKSDDWLDFDGDWPASHRLGDA